MEEKQTTADKISHFLTVHFSHGEKSASLTLKKQHAIAVCMVAFTFFAGGLFLLHSYYSAKTQLAVSTKQLQEITKDKNALEKKTKKLETEKAEYEQNITAIQNKTSEIEHKLLEIEQVKEELYEQLHTLEEENSSASFTSSKIVNRIQSVDCNTPKFTTLVQTAYSQVSALSTDLDRLDQQLDTTGIEFIDIAENVTETLSSLSSTPSGYPCSGRLTTRFNPTGDPSISDGRVHKGLDIATNYNHPVVATASGTVTEAEFSPSYGYYVKINHENGFETMYAHDTSLNVSVGDTINQGDVIAFAGSTGNSTGVHVHYEIILNGIYQDPEDYLN